MSEITLADKLTCAKREFGYRRKPRRLKSKRDRQMARRMRDQQWGVMERVERIGTLWICWWNKNSHHDERRARLPADLHVCGLIDGVELLEWMKSHDDWWEIGEWNDGRYAAPVRLTDAGRAALADRSRYDMEPVTGGLVEPGWIATPEIARSPSRRIRMTQQHMDRYEAQVAALPVPPPAPDLFNRQTKDTDDGKS